MAPSNIARITSNDSLAQGNLYCIIPGEFSYYSAQKEVSKYEFLTFESISVRLKTGAVVPHEIEFLFYTPSMPMARQVLERGQMYVTGEYSPPRGEDPAAVIFKDVALLEFDHELPTGTAYRVDMIFLPVKASIKRARGENVRCVCRIHEWRSLDTSLVAAFNNLMGVKQNAF